MGQQATYLSSGKLAKPGESGTDEFRVLMQPLMSWGRRIGAQRRIRLILPPYPN